MKIIVGTERPTDQQYEIENHVLPDASNYYEGARILVCDDTHSTGYAEFTYECRSAKLNSTQRYYYWYLFTDDL